MISVIIADDHQIVVDGLVSILEMEADIDVVGTARNGNQVIQLLTEQKVDVAILDIEMPGLTGVQLSEIIRDKYPSTQVLILSMYNTKNFVQQIINSGAKGYILKNKGKEELVKAIRYVHMGQGYVGQEITDVMMEALKEKSKPKKEPKFVLTKREKEVLALIAQGFSSIEIGKKLFIAPTTVDTHRRNLIDKLDVSNSKELIVFAIKNNLDIT
ncbi:MAG: response regulator transcription factor [Bacteroidota bacterium]